MSDPSDSKQSKPISSETTSEPTISGSSKKKSRLQWDEENLMSNAAEMERAGPRMKIDEPKTPYLASETGSSTSGSAHQSPPGSPAFIPGERLVGFTTLEQQHGAGVNVSSDGLSSAGSGPRSVHISEDVFASSGGSSPHSSEGFVARRKAHYRNEAKAIARARRLSQDDNQEDGVNNLQELPNGTDAAENPVQQQPTSNGNTPGEEEVENGNVTDNLEPRINGSLPNGHTHSESTSSAPDDNG